MVHIVSSEQLTDFGLSKVGLISSTDDLSGPDFGASSLFLEEKPKWTTSEHEFGSRDKRSAVGTPDYLAPEILLGTGHGAHMLPSNLFYPLVSIFQIVLLSRNWW